MTKKNAFMLNPVDPLRLSMRPALGVIEAARENTKIGTVFAGKNGIIGALREELIDTNRISSEALANLRFRPGAALAPCRYKLKNIEDSDSDYRRLIEVFKSS